MSHRATTVAVLGGGVIGITTGLLLNLMGYKTRLYTNFRPDTISANEPKKDKHKEYASLHAAASIIPHSVEVSGKYRAGTLTEISQRFFHRLCFAATCGVRMQRHYEVFESPEKDPEYVRAVFDFKRLDNDALHSESAPKRREAKQIFGWSFNAFFAEAPRYLRVLYRLYEGVGGDVRTVKRLIQLESVAQDDDIHAIIFCAGSEARHLLPSEHAYAEFARGHYLKIKTHEVPLMKTETGVQYFSYNYTPSPTVYAKDADRRNPADLYFYPRSDGWLLGGSRQVGRLEPETRNGEVHEVWQAEASFTEKMRVDEATQISYPAPILDINRSLIHDLTGLDVLAYPRFAGIGYRYTRSNGVRLELDHLNKKPVVYNYGHGGAGYTLSWGCALEVAKILGRETNHKPLWIKQTGKEGDFALLTILVDLLEQLIEEDNGEA